LKSYQGHICWISNNWSNRTSQKWKGYFLSKSKVSFFLWFNSIL
jgi:hypothetical protein